MRERITRTALSLLAVVAAVLAFRWTVRTAMSRAYRAERDVRPMEVAVAPAEKVHDLARLVPAELLPESCRSWGLSLAALGSHAASCAVVAAYRPSALAIGDGGALLVFAGLSLASTILLACLLPETLRTR